MKKLLPFILLFFAFSGYSQSKASLNSWKGLTIDESTFDDATKALGTPAKDKPNERFVPIVYSKWFGNKPQKGFRKVTFKGMEGFDKAELYFLNEKLVVIALDMKKDLAASALVDAYDSKFFPLVGNFGKAVTPNQLAEPDREIIYPEDGFPLAYEMAAANERTLGLAYASAGFGETFAATLAAPRGRTPKAISASLPGVVRTIQLVSRKLENTKGTDLLK